MRTVNVYYASDNSLCESLSGETMPIAMRRAITVAKRIRPQVKSNLYLRDCLGGLRAEVIMRDGKAYAKIT